MMKSFSCCSVLPMMLALVLTACSAANVLLFESSNDVVCSRDGAVCEGPSSTCCRGQSGEWSCCPFKDGVCCSDGAHCCPSGSTCDASRSACLPLTNNTADSSLPKSWPAIRRIQSVETSSLSSPVNAGLQCADKKTVCPLAKSACCRDYIGRYSCCQYPNNVCCDDGQHCCLSGTVCDSLRQQCLSTSADNSISWIPTSSATSGDLKASSGLESSDKASEDETEMLEIAVNHSEEHQPRESMAGVNGYCPDGTPCFGTCCLQSVYPLRYGCCPYVYATCCPGGTTCCAAGYHCVGNKCIRSS